MATKTKSVEEPEVVTTSADEPIVVDEPGETPAAEAPAAKNEPEKEPEAEAPAANNEPEAPKTTKETPEVDDIISIDGKELKSQGVITHVNLPEKLTKENLVKYVTKPSAAAVIAKKL